MEKNPNFNNYLYDALHQETHGELIWKRDAINALDGEMNIKGKSNADAVINYINDIRGKIQDIPSVVPERPSGQWMTTYLDHEACGVRPKMFYCSKCNQCVPFPMSYCPACGSHNSGGGA